MRRGPHFGNKPATDFVAKAKAAWGEQIPDWVLTLAEEANRTTAKAVADRVGYSAAVLSHVFSKSYIGDMQRVEEKARGVFMGMKVTCPVLGEIGRDHCLDEQKKPFSASSSVRSKVYRACRGGCEHSRLKQKETRDA